MTLDPIVFETFSAQIVRFVVFVVVGGCCVGGEATHAGFRINVIFSTSSAYLFVFSLFKQVFFFLLLFFRSCLKKFSSLRHFFRFCILCLPSSGMSKRFLKIIATWPPLLPADSDLLRSRSPVFCGISFFVASSERRRRKIIKARKGNIDLVGTYLFIIFEILSWSAMSGKLIRSEASLSLILPASTDFMAL